VYEASIINMRSMHEHITNRQWQQIYKT